MTGVYISIPFCSQKCTYCNFASGVFPAELLREYLDALEAELTAKQWSEPPDTVYLGGGTPSLLEPKALARLLARLPLSQHRAATMRERTQASPVSLCPLPCNRGAASQAAAGFSPPPSRPEGRRGLKGRPTFSPLRCAPLDHVELSNGRGSVLVSSVREATLEAAPGTVTADRAAAWRAMGINRVSLGVQSFVPREIAATGRKHSAELVQKEIELLRSQGISNINIDLIAGLPHQARETWRESLAWIERLAPPHVSVYILETDEDSRLGREVLRGGSRYGAGALPNDDQVAELYLEAVERLGRLGIHRYEISNFARPGFESAHNLKYWRLAPYRGFGADAHSFDGHRRWSNVETAAEYVERFRRGLSPVDHSEPVDRRRRMEEHFFLGLRQTAGIEPDEEERLHFAEPIRRLTEDRLLEAEGGRLRLTNSAVLISNLVFQEFIGA